ncbi:MAG: sugar transferase [Pseudomonadota bacterium]
MSTKSVAHEEAAPAATMGEILEYPTRKKPHGGSPTLKRLMDLLIAIPAAIFLSPGLLALAIWVYLDDGGPVIFAHTRRGKDGKPFKCLKFRTMVRDADAKLKVLLDSDPVLKAEWDKNQKLKVDPRLTKNGGFLRKYSLDELPQLWNIIKGDMSIVGPRPIVEDEVSRYGRDIASYDALKPGVVGIWQISGRNDTTYDERVAMDAHYAEHQTVGTDIMILLKSIPAILCKRGAY